MIEHLRLENVGPAPEMALDFAPRVNLLTGDNGLGKSFLMKNGARVDFPVRCGGVHRVG